MIEKSSQNRCIKENRWLVGTGMQVLANGLMRGMEIISGCHRYPVIEWIIFYYLIEVAPRNVFSPSIPNFWG